MKLDASTRFSINSLPKLNNSAASDFEIFLPSRHVSALLGSDFLIRTDGLFQDTNAQVLAVYQSLARN